MPSNSKYIHKRERFSPTFRLNVLYSQYYKCAVCKELLNPAAVDIDHIIPLYRGGDNSLSNLQALCKNCHGIKTYNQQCPFNLSNYQTFNGGKDVSIASSIVWTHCSESQMKILIFIKIQPHTV